MTRNEQILSEVQKRYLSDYTHIASKINAFVEGANWADEHPNTEDIETVLAYTYKGLGWLAENVEFDMGTMGDRALAHTETLQIICNQAIMELRKPNKKIKL